MSNNEHALWVERYRPKTVSEAILTPTLKETFQKIVDKGIVPNITIAGSAGTGKTTVARAMLEELDYTYILINGSRKGGQADTFRTDVANFASAVSFDGNRKAVIVDEADGLTKAVQDELRAFIEQYSENCAFILTCNHKQKLSEAMLSRCPIIDMHFSDDDRAKLSVQFFKRLTSILTENNVTFDKKVLAELVKKDFPDFRSILGKLQLYSNKGSIDEGVLTQIGNLEIHELIGHLKSKNWMAMRNWVGLSSVDTAALVSSLWAESIARVVPSSLPQFTLTIGDYQCKAATALIEEVNIVAMLTELMRDIEWK